MYIVQWTYIHSKRWINNVLNARDNKRQKAKLTQSARNQLWIRLCSSVTSLSTLLEGNLCVRKKVKSATVQDHFVINYNTWWFFNSFLIKCEFGDDDSFNFARLTICKSALHWRLVGSAHTIYVDSEMEMRFKWLQTVNEIKFNHTKYTGSL